MRCSVCSFENAAASRFCKACRAPLLSAVPRAGQSAVVGSVAVAPPEVSSAPTGRVDSPTVPASPTLHSPSPTPVSSTPSPARAAPSSPVPPVAPAAPRSPAPTTPPITSATRRRTKVRPVVIVGVAAVLLAVGVAAGFVVSRSGDAGTVPSASDGAASTSPSPSVKVAPTEVAPTLVDTTVTTATSLATTVVATTAVATTAVATTAFAPTTVPPVSTTAPAPVVPAGDLALSVPITQPACDGKYITLIGAAVTPAAYVSQLDDLLARYPQSSYLRTENVCSSLRPRMPDGSAIYAVYFGPFASAGEACAARASGPTDAYVKVLDNFSDPTTAIEC